MNAFIKGSIPFILLLTCGISPFMFDYQWYQDYKNSGAMGLDIGFSYICAPVFFWYYFRKSFCFFPKSCVIGLVTMVTLCRISIWFPELFTYNQWYDFTISWIFVIIGVSFYLNGK